MKRSALKAKPRSKGYCECGCGQMTRIAPSSWAARGWVKGEPVRFISGHNNAQRRIPWWAHDLTPGPLSTSCWIHRKRPTEKGYVQIRGHDGRLVMAHRLFYELRKGPIPVGYQLDHLCRNRACVNPEHLEIVTCKENIERGHRARAA